MYLHNCTVNIIEVGETLPNDYTNVTKGKYLNIP